MDAKFEVTIQGRTFGAKTWKELALGIAAAFNIQGAAQPECPVFVLRADEPGHLHTLIELQNYSWTREAEQSVRAFELWEEAHRR